MCKWKFFEKMGSRSNTIWWNHLTSLIIWNIWGMAPNMVDKPTKIEGLEFFYINNNQNPAAKNIKVNNMLSPGKAHTINIPKLQEIIARPPTRRNWFGFIIFFRMAAPPLLQFMSKRGWKCMYL